MARSHWSGPVQSSNGFNAGGGTDITYIEKGAVSVIVGTTAAATVADISVSITNATVGDIVLVTPPNSAMETNLGIIGAWVSANGTVKIRIRNNYASTTALTGSTSNWQYCLIRS